MLYDAGTGLLPGPVQELHAVDVTDSEVTLSWEPPSDNGNVTDYVIHYNKVDNTSMHETLLKLDNVSNFENVLNTVFHVGCSFQIYSSIIRSRIYFGTILCFALVLKHPM